MITAREAIDRRRCATAGRQG